MDIAKNIQQLQKELGSSECKLIAVSKTKPVSTLMDAYEAGIRDFGENKVQEMVEKYEQMPKDIRWHMIGHLQRNKVKYIAPFVHLIHSVDSIRLMEEVNKQAAKHDRTVSCLLQVHIAEEESKYGF
ncbi:MAG: YggS family pyridoxal phosphate-dependent enzyme, partial [Bacteroidota bacterium]